MTIYHSALELIGNTPLIQLHHFDTGCCELFLKCENQNPGGSVKDRIALHLINAAEKSGQLKPGGVIVEATSGNTGLSLAMVARLKGYRAMIVLPDKMSREKILHLKALGAEIVITRSDVNKGHPEYYQDLAEQLVKNIPNAYYVDQFANPENPIAHEQTTGPEIWQDMNGKIDAFIAGVGSGGTLTGVGRYLRKMNSNIRLVLADPEGSILANYINLGIMGTAKPWLVEGIGEDFIPPITELDKINEAITVSDKNAFQTTHELLKKEGLFAGPSTGTLLHAALMYCRKQTTPQRVVTLLCDTGNKYLSKCFNDDWLFSRGLSNQKTYHDLRDVIRMTDNEKPFVFSSRHDLLMSVYARMSNHHVNFLPVIENNNLVGIISEKMLLTAIADNPEHWQHTAETIMQTTFARCDCTQSFSELQTQLTTHAVVALYDKQTYLGCISPMDLIHYFKRQHS